MPKDESSGLFSKVVKFVRNSGSGWSENESDSEQESSYSKQMLKEMIERKRRILRSMSNSRLRTGSGSYTTSGMPPDSTPRSSSSGGSTTHGSLPRGQGIRPGPVGPYDRTVPQPLPASRMPAAAPVVPLAPVRPAAPVAAAPVAAPPATPKPAPELEPLQWEELPAAKSAAPVAAPAATPAASAASRAGTESIPNSGGFSASKVFAIDVEEFAHDPELEEAAIRFANGDDSGAEAGLMEVLGPGGPRIDHDETWLTLFDLYRATGQQDRFEAAAIEFAGRFNRSAPQWISLPEAVGKMGAAAAAAPATGNFAADWTCPSTLGTQTLAALNAALTRFPQPWRLAWTKLNSIEEGAIEGLTRLFAQWAAEPVQLRFVGADAIDRVLRAATPSGDNGVNPAWWRLRMEVLRVMHRPDEFELVALDYCVTYEVSPPSWDSARCDFKPLQADGTALAGSTIIGEAFRDSLSSNLGYADSLSAPLSSQMAQVATVELAGQILGDAKEALDMLDVKLAGADFMVISCARLIRIDFTAAGTLLNWVSARQAEGRQVQFIEVHRLVAAFYNVIGISEHSRVSARRD